MRSRVSAWVGGCEGEKNGERGAVRAAAAPNTPSTPNHLPDS